MRAAILLMLWLILLPTHAALPLPALGASGGQLTVSGVSAGAYMAVQFQVAHSALVAGVGVIAGGPYECAEGAVSRALKNCMSPTVRAPPPTADHTWARVEARARAGLIDPPEGLRDDRAWVFSGAADRVVERTVVTALVDFYHRYLDESALVFVRHPRAGHAMLSVADSQANACETSEPPFINLCEDLDAPGELLTHLLGPLAARGIPQGTLRAFDQRPFADGRPFDLSMADRGYVYIPPDCERGACRLHMALHGCRQTEAQIGRRFIEDTGYNEWADANRLIVLYPQAAPRRGLAWRSWRWVFNPEGCWDWWGYTGPEYATRNGPQIQALRAMLDRLME